MLLLIKKDTYASVVYHKAVLKMIVKFLYISLHRYVMLWCEHSLRCNLHSFPNICLSQHTSDYMSGWGAVWVLDFFVKKYRYAGNNRASVTPTSSFGVNNQKTRICGGPLSVFPLVGKRQLETTVNCKLCRCSIYAGCSCV